jgi:L,D-peptidoglycan transpeptidase YkuD (ErfK/YbiS/YcfS/YnhG family)
MVSRRVVGTVVTVAALIATAVLAVSALVAWSSRPSHHIAAPAAPTSSASASASVFRLATVPPSTSARQMTSTPVATSAPAKSPKAPPPALAPPTRDTASGQLPVPGSTGVATQVITVAAPSSAATRATLQAWHKSSSGWVKVGPAISAWLGYGGMTANAREGFNGTPIGSFSLTHAFGNNADPGSRLPYFQADANDWWSGDSASSTYNSHQHCAPGACPFRTGESENLHDASWVYGYAVVIDYNVGPAVPGKGSAFFLHVTENKPTQGCVSIPQGDVVRLLRWLDPAQHPRIIMGVS